MKYLAILCFSLFTINAELSFGNCNIPKPANVKVSAYTSCNATITWDAVPGAAYYNVKYGFKYITGWTIISTQLHTTSYTFPDLIADSNYKFAVTAFCFNGDNSGYKAINKKLRSVTIPNSLTASNPQGNSVSLTWVASCPTPSFNVRSRVTSTHSWTVAGNILTSNYVVSNITPNTSYDFQVQGQNGTNTTNWTPLVTLNSDTLSSAPSLPFKPNILLFVLDDGRYDQFQPNGGPAWFETPSINRIANEGINFLYSFPTTSQCAPSRMSIYSGLYGHHHGAIDNNTRHYDGIPLVQEILQNAGYYTGFVGKYGQLQSNPKGFDWWATSDGEIYNNPPYKINGKDTAISGHITDVYQNLAMTFLNKVPQGEKFCLMFFTRAPHLPTTPRVQDQNLYTTQTMPFPDNFYRYTENYPSFLYANSGHSWSYNHEETDSIKLLDFQCSYGAEVNMTAFLDWLTTRGILDSTIIIFTSDNGYMKGEHRLKAKQLVQEESIRVPMFIRYPAWFTAGEVNTNIMALNIDIAPTLMEAAGITDTFGIDGVSLLKIYNHSLQRKYFYYQFAGEGGTPSLRAVRSSQYKYAKTYCTQLTEEFYDLTIDPKENTNQINNSSYSSLISSYRIVMDSIKTALGDTNPVPVDCFLSNPEYQRVVNEDTEEFNLRNLEVYPNPASQYFMIHFNDEEREDIEVWVTNLFDEKTYYKKLPNTNTITMMVNASDWPAGLYLVTLKKGNGIFTRKFTIH